MSDTTLRARRDEWIDAGVFESLKTEALAAFGVIIGLDLDHVALDGSLHKTPGGGEGTGPNPTERAKLGWKWSVASERHGIPSAGRSTAPTATTCACSNPPSMRSPTLACSPISAPYTSDQGYDSGAVRDRLRDAGIDQFEIQLRGTKVPA